MKNIKKIGILHGMEETFPAAFVSRVNEIVKKESLPLMAEHVLVDKVEQGVPTDYAVIIDRISQDVPFYRAYLKNAAACGTAVINNPFWWSADEKFFNNVLATQIGVPVPKTVLLPSRERPTDTTERSFKNLKFPLSWETIFERIGFPAYMKPHSGGGWKSVYKVENMEDFFNKYAETEQLVMLLQEEIQFTEYFRCYCLGGKRVHIMPYEPRNPHHLRYVSNAGPATKKLLDTVEKYVLALNHALGYDFNTVEFAVRDGIPYAIDFCNPAPDADIHSVGQENFDWIVENAARMAIERAMNHKDGQDNLTWGTYIKAAAVGGSINTGNQAKKETAAPSKAASPKAAKEAKPTVEKKAPVKEVVAEKPKAAKKETEVKADDLKIIEGIGPKIAEILIAAGITTFAELAKTKATKIKELLDGAGSRYKMHDPTSWPKQADLAAKGKMEELKKLQDELNAGK